ncbi:MAG: hypothetical protein WBQ79_13210 [Acidobacteriaceae bacterium]
MTAPIHYIDGNDVQPVPPGRILSNYVAGLCEAARKKMKAKPIAKAAA